MHHMNATVRTTFAPLAAALSAPELLASSLPLWQGPHPLRPRQPNRCAALILHIFVR